MKATLVFGPRYAVPCWTVTVRGECGSAMLSRAELVQEQVACYLSSRPAGVVDVEYSEHCGACGGSGRKSVGKRVRRYVNCKACKGHPFMALPMRLTTHVGPQWTDRAV